MAKHVVVYSNVGCMPCKMTKDFLERQNVAYEERNLSENESYVEEVRRLGFTGVPVVVVDGEVVAKGFQPEKLQKI